MTRHFLAALAAIILGASLALAAPPSPAKPTSKPAPAASAPAPIPALNIDPGYQTNVPLPGATDGQTCEIYVSRAQPKAGVRRPVLFVLGKSSSMNNKWINTMGLAAWAEENAAIIIGVNTLFIATPPASTAPAIGKAVPTEEAMDPYMAYADSLPGVHPNIRLAVCDDANLTGQLRVLAVAQRYPSKIAGVVVGPRLYEPYKDSPEIRIGQGAGVAVLAVTWEAYAKAHPTKPYVIGTDDLYGNDKFESTIGEALRSARVPMCYVETDDFITVKPERLRTGLNWLLENAWLGKTGTNKAEVAAAKEDLQTLLKKASEETDVATREQKLRDLLIMTNVANDDGKAYLTPWRQAVLLAADTRTETLFKLAYMKRMAAFGFMKNSPEAAKLDAKIAALEADPKAKKEIEGEKKVRELAEKVGSLGVDQKTLQTAKALQADFQKLITDYPDTLAAKEAQDWSNIMDRRIKNTTARPIRSKSN